MVHERKHDLSKVVSTSIKRSYLASFIKLSSDAVLSAASEPLIISTKEHPKHQDMNNDARS